MNKQRSSARSAVAYEDRTDNDRPETSLTPAPGAAQLDDLIDAPSSGDGVVAILRQRKPAETDDDAGEDLRPGVSAERSGPASASDVEPVPGYTPIAQARASTEGVARGEPQPLDAWYAAYGDPATIERMAHRQQELTRTIIEVVIGADDRVKIGNTTVYPWRAICSLAITAANGSNWIGTGWLVAPRTVITAGHCVWMHNQGGRVASIRVMPGRNGSATETPFKSCLATHVRTTVKWIDDRDSDRDYGCVLLPQSFMDYSSLGTFGYASLSDLENMTVNLSGYPGDKPTGTQWFHSRKIKNVESRRFSYDIDTAGGQSGAPVWRFKDNQRHVVGIHTNGSSTGNSAVRITSAVFDNIKAWKHWYD